MNITKNIIGALLAISILTVSALAVSAANQEEVKQAIQDGDYETFQELTQDRPNAPEISEDDFSKLQEAHGLMESGDQEAAKAIFEEIGLKGPRGGHHGERGGEIREAVESGDYETWAAAVEERGGDSSQATFEIIQKAHELHKTGDHESAKELLEENGIERPQGKFGKHRGGNCEGPEQTEE
jgi:anti-sigma28 factor (negative regulator of flagellin synthesis)